MLFLLLGIIIFLAVHSVRIFADGWRTSFIEQRGEMTFKGLYSLASLIGLILLVIGYGQTRVNPTFLWHPPIALLHIASLLMLVAFIVLAAAYVPKNTIKARVGHPMVLSVKIWAIAHLLANGRLGDVLLFAAFLIWAVLSFISAKRRDRLAGTKPSSDAQMSRTVATVVIGVVAWLVFALWMHLWIIGVSPFVI